MSNPSEQEPQYAYSEVAKAYDDAIGLPDVRRTKYSPGSENVPGASGCIYAYPATYNAAERTMAKKGTDMRLDEEQALFVVGTARLVNIGTIYRNAEQTLNSKELSEQRRGVAKFIMSQIDILWGIYMKYLRTDSSFLIEDEIVKLKQIDLELKDTLNLPSIYSKRISKDVWKLSLLQQGSSSTAELIECLIDRPERPIISMDKKIGIFAQAVTEGDIHSSKVAPLAKHLGLPEEETKELIAILDQCNPHNT